MFEKKRAYPWPGHVCGNDGPSRDTLVIRFVGVTFWLRRFLCWWSTVVGFHRPTLTLTSVMEAGSVLMDVCTCGIQLAMTWMVSGMDLMDAATSTLVIIMLVGCTCIFSMAFHLMNQSPPVEPEFYKSQKTCSQLLNDVDLHLNGTASPHATGEHQTTGKKLWLEEVGERWLGVTIFTLLLSLVFISQAIQGF